MRWFARWQLFAPALAHHQAFFAVDPVGALDVDRRAVDSKAPDRAFGAHRTLKSSVIARICKALPLAIDCFAAVNRGSWMPALGRLLSTNLAGPVTGSVHVVDLQSFTQRRPTLPAWPTTDPRPGRETRVRSPHDAIVCQRRESGMTRLQSHTPRPTAVINPRRARPDSPPASRPRPPRAPSRYRPAPAARRCCASVRRAPAAVAMRRSRAPGRRRRGGRP